MNAMISVADLSKIYGSGFKALDAIDLEIRRGEIFGLLLFGISLPGTEIGTEYSKIATLSKEILEEKLPKTNFISNSNKEYAVLIK